MYLCGVQYYLIIHGWNELERVTLCPLRVSIFRQRCLILFIKHMSNYHRLDYLSILQSGSHNIRLLFFPPIKKYNNYFFFNQRVPYFKQILFFLIGGYVTLNDFCIKNAEQNFVKK